MDEERQRDEAAQRYAELKRVLDATPLWGKIVRESDNRLALVANGLSEVIDDLAWLVTRPEGWLRITNTEDGARVHYKFKFVDTRWWNSYVYYVTEGPRLAEGLDGLRRKVEQVLNGERKPTNDRPYDHH